MIRAICIDCESGFYREAADTWRVRCLGCWRRRKNLQAHEIEDAYSDGYDAGFAQGRASARDDRLSRLPAIEPKRLRQLRQLCHPDKHAGSALSNEVSAWLNSLRAEATA